jgi:hypothetical protein
MFKLLLLASSACLAQSAFAGCDAPPLPASAWQQVRPDLRCKREGSDLTRCEITAARAGTFRLEATSEICTGAGSWLKAMRIDFKINGKPRDDCVPSNRLDPLVSDTWIQTAECSIGMKAGDRAEILVRHNRAGAQPKEIAVAGSYLDEARVKTVRGRGPGDS